MCKAIILLALVAAANCAFPNYFDQQRQQYLQRQRQSYYQQTPDATATVLRNDQEVNPESFNYAYETSNGIQAQETGQLRQIGRDAAIVTQGSYSYTSPEGEPISITYIADENGYQPTGSHIPTPPPIPAAIQRSLDYIARVNAGQQPKYPQYNQYNSQQRYNFQRF